MTSVLLSILALIPFFFIVKKYTSPSIAWCATLLFSSNYVYLQFSRVGWTNIHAVCVGLYFLWISDLAAVKKSWIFTGISAALAGILSYTYRAAELFIVAGIIQYTVTLFASRAPRRVTYGLLVVFISIVSLIASPWVYTITHNWERYTLRARVVSVFNTQKPYHGFTTRQDILKDQLWQTYRSWILFVPMNTQAIENIRYIPDGHRALSYANIVLFWIGFAVALLNIRYYYLWILIYGAGLYAGQVLTVDPPNGGRALILFPVIFLFIGLGLNKLREIIGKNNRLSMVVIYAVTITVSLLEISTYMDWMSWISLR
jgi:hypothetical protein